MNPPPRDAHPVRHLFTVAGMVLVTLVLLALLVAAAFYARTYLGSGQMAAIVTAVLVDLTNEEREGLPELRVNPVLVAAAQAKANDMAEKGYFAHNSPDGKTSWYWFREAGYSFAYAGENLAVDFSDSEDVVEAWMDSPTHRANIVNGKFTEIGIATASGEYEGRKATFVVQMFGTPAKVAAAAPVAEIEPEEISAAPTAVLGSSAEPAPIAAAVEVKGAEPVASTVEGPPAHAPVWSAPVASPKSFLRDLYIVAAALLLIALAFVTRLEWRRHHLPHAYAAGLMLIVLSGLFLAADRLVFTEPTIGEAEQQSEAV